MQGTALITTMFMIFVSIFLAELGDNINELNIGFSIIAQAVFDGLEKAVIDMKKILLKY